MGRATLGIEAAINTTASSESRDIPQPSWEMAQSLSQVMTDIHRRGWCDGTGGNFSCVLQRDPLRLLMAPSGVDKGSVLPEALIEVDGEARVLRGNGKASAETKLHLRIVEETGAGAVLHTHSQAATLLSQWAADWAADHEATAAAAGHTAAAQHERGPQGREPLASVMVKNLEMLKGLRGITTHQSVVCIPVVANDQNLQRLSDMAAPHLQRAPHGLLVAGHGLYAWGADLREAQRHLEILEFLLEQRWRQLLLDALVRPQARQPQSTAMPSQGE